MESKTYVFNPESGTSGTGFAVLSGAGHHTSKCSFGCTAGRGGWYQVQVA